MTAQDWTEDYYLQNGNYENICNNCGCKFFGHKRRVTCKQCSFTEVSQLKFVNFLAQYPRKLELDTTGICEPTMRSYNDFSDGVVWPQSMVAKVKLNHDGPFQYYIRNKRK